MTSESNIVTRLRESRKKILFEDTKEENVQEIVDEVEVEESPEEVAEPAIIEDENGESKRVCECGSSDIIEEDGKSICNDCGRTVEPQEKVVEAAADQDTQLKIAALKKAMTWWQAGHYQKAVQLYKKYGVSDTEFARALVGSLREEEEVEGEELEESFQIKPGVTFKNAGYTWEILAVKGEDTLVYSAEKKLNPYTVAWRLDPRDGAWVQGHYFDDYDRALKYLKKQPGLLQLKESTRMQTFHYEVTSKKTGKTFIKNFGYFNDEAGFWKTMAEDYPRHLYIVKMTKPKVVLRENEELEVIEPQEDSNLDSNIIRAIQTPVSTKDKPSIDSAIMEAMKGSKIEEAVEVDTSRWSYSSGKKVPSGYGMWYFSIGDEEVPFSGQYSDAKKRAIQYAKEHKVSRITLLT